jgi:hypothetical protein
MTKQEFFEYYNGKYIDLDNFPKDNPYQCMDEMHRYIVDVLGLPMSLFAAPTAIVAWNNANDDRFEKIINDPNNPNQVPPEGAIIFWKTNHVAIVIEAKVGENKFTSLDQNYPTGSPCHIQEHTYSNIAGWLVFKEVNLQEELDKARTRRDELWNILTNLCTILGIGADEQMTGLTADVTKLRDIQSEVADRDIKLEKANLKIEGLVSDIKGLTDSNTKLSEVNTTLSKKVGIQGEDIKIQETKIGTLTDEINNLKITLKIKALTGWRKKIAQFLLK